GPTSLMVRGRVFCDAEKVALRVGKRGPLDVRDFVQDIPLVRGPRTGQALGFGRRGSPRGGEVPVRHEKRAKREDTSRKSLPNPRGPWDGTGRASRYSRILGVSHKKLVMSW